jgi:hypothetical protein
MDWWLNNNADSIESNWLERRHLITIEKDSFFIHYPDTLTLIEDGSFIFPRRYYLSQRDYGDSYLSDMELIIMSRTLYKQKIGNLYKTDKDFIRLFSFKEKNPIIIEYYLDSQIANYTITNGFSWTHGEVIDSGKFDISLKQSNKIKTKLRSWTDDNPQIYRSSELTDFVIEFKIENEYCLIKLSRSDYRQKANKRFIKLIEQLENSLNEVLLENRN